jgi:hypothetical protein
MPSRPEGRTVEEQYDGLLLVHEREIRDAVGVEHTRATQVARLQQHGDPRRQSWT